jgi:hypothetical protein
VVSLKPVCQEIWKVGWTFKQNNQPDAHSVVKFIAYKRCSTCFEQHSAHHQEHFQTAVAASGFLIKVEVDVFPAVVCLLVVH